MTIANLFRNLPLVALLFWAVATADGATVRFEAESIAGPYDKNDAVGYDPTIDVNSGLPNGPTRSLDPTSSNGTILEATSKLFGSTQWEHRVKVGFVGSGLNLIARTDVDGTEFDWILDEGAQSGSGTTVAGSRTDQASIPIVTGLANTLHTLEIRRKGTGILRVDAVDVLDAGTQTRYEQNDPALVSAGIWNLNNAGASAEASSSSIGFTTCGPGLGGPCGTVAPTLTLPFVGTAVSFIAQLRANSQNWTYSIDGGPAQNLTLVGAVPGGIPQRWPFLLANNLAPGAHTLVLASDLPPGVAGIAVHIDAIDVFGVPEPATVGLLGLAVFGFGAVARVRRN